MDECAAGCNARIEDLNFIECDSCAGKFHINCAAISKTACGTVKANSSIKWFCAKCEELWTNNQSCLSKIEMIWGHLTKHDEKFNVYIKQMSDLNEKLDKMHVNETSRKETYAEKVKLQKNDPIIIVRPRDVEQRCVKTRNEIKAKIDPASLPVNGLRNAAKGSVIIEVKDKESTEIVKKKTEETLGVDYTVEIVKAKNPRIKIMGVYDKTTKEDLLTSIRSQNDCISEDATVEIIKIDKSRKFKDNYNIIVEIDPKTYGKIMEVNKLNIGWNRCRVLDHIYVIRCFKCEQYGHFAKDCKNAETCGICAESHHTKECKSEVFKCTNCVNAVKKLNLQLDVNHPVWSDECKVYKRIESSKKRSINYYE
jgi:hypothetical protein